MCVSAGRRHAQRRRALTRGTSAAITLAMHTIRTSFALVALLVSSFARADGGGDVEVVRSQFTDKVENHQPVAGSDQLAQANVVTYWVAVKNSKEPTTV